MYVNQGALTVGKTKTVYRQEMGDTHAPAAKDMSEKAMSVRKPVSCTSNSQEIFKEFGVFSDFW